MAFVNRLPDRDEPMDLNGNVVQIGPKDRSDYSPEQTDKPGVPMINLEYNLKILDYTHCVTKFLNNHTMPYLLEKQLERLDLDSVCAYELYQMKKSYVDGPTLNLSQFEVWEAKNEGKYTVPVRHHE